MSNEKAFTLIEVIVSLVLLGIIAAVAGMGLVKIVEGYVFAKQNAETVQKAQVAIARMVKELGTATSISTTSPFPSATGITYSRPGLTDNVMTIAAGQVQMSKPTSGKLIDNVVMDSASAFKYYDGTGTEIATPNAATVPAIRRIDISLKINGANSTPISFSNNTVFLREFN